jgi:hypothetical protein
MYASAQPAMLLIEREGVAPEQIELRPGKHIGSGGATNQHALLEPFSLLMLYFVIPLTVITLLIVVWRGLRAQRRLVPPATD